MKDNSEKPTVELISDKTSQQLRGLERRSLPRLSVTKEQFKCNEDGIVYAVNDLSLNGMGLWLFEDTPNDRFTVGQKNTGTLSLKGNRLAVEIRVRNRSADRVGSEFIDPSPELTQALKDFLAPETLGSELRPIPASGRYSLWYHGPSGTDLLIKRSADGQYQQWTLYVFGYFVQWDIDSGWTSGRTFISGEKSSSTGIVRLETLFFEKDAKPDSEKLAIAKRIVLSSNLTEELKNWSMQKFQQSER